MHTSKPDKLYFPFLLHASAQNYVCHIDSGDLNNNNKQQKHKKENAQKMLEGFRTSEIKLFSRPGNGSV